MILAIFMRCRNKVMWDELIGKPEAPALINQHILTEKIYGLIGMRPLILILLMRRPSILVANMYTKVQTGESWSIISPDLTTNDTTKQMQHESGGLTMDATGAENHTTILAIEPSPLEKNVIWVGTDDGNIQVTTDGGENWTNTAGNLKDIPEGSYVAQVKASRFNEGEAVAVINNYRRGDWTPYVMHTTNYGKKWSNIVEAKGLEGYALSFVQDLVEPNLMFVGTEFGLYFTINGGDSWTRWTNGYPTVSTYDMVMHPREHDLVIGLLGALFGSDDIRPLRELAAEGIDELEKPIKAFDAQMRTWQTGVSNGNSFCCRRNIFGDNRPRGAMITFSVNKELSKKSDKADFKLLAVVHGEEEGRMRSKLKWPSLMNQVRISVILS